MWFNFFNAVFKTIAIINHKICCNQCSNMYSGSMVSHLIHFTPKENKVNQAIANCTRIYWQPLLKVTKLPLFFTYNSSSYLAALPIKSTCKTLNMNILYTHMAQIPSKIFLMSCDWCFTLKLPSNKGRTFRLSCLLIHSKQAIERGTLCIFMTV